MITLFLALLVLPLPARAQTVDSCDSLYTAAQEARDAVGEELGEFRSSEAEKRAWRQTVQRLLHTAKRVRDCYNPLLLMPNPPDTSASDEPDASALPTPTSRVRQRVMRTYDWTALAYRQLQEYDAAFRELNRFFARFSAAADSSEIAFMFNKRGYLHYTLGNLTESINDYTRTIAYTPAADTLDRADLMIDLGTILQKIDDLSTAQEYYARAERLVRNASASMHRREILGRALFNQGDVLRLTGSEAPDTPQATRLRRSVDLLQQAIAIFSEEWASRRARAHAMLADAYRRMGALDKAAPHAEKGRQLAETSRSFRGTRADVLALATRIRGHIEFDAGRPDAAAASYTEALRFAEAGDNQSRRLFILMDLGKVYEAHDDPVRAETYYRQAIAGTNKMRASLRATEWASFASDDWSVPHRGLMRVLLAQDRPDEAFLALDRSRARHLQDRQLQTRLTSRLPPRHRVRFDSLTAELAAVRNTLATNDLSPNRRSTLEQDEVHLMATRRSLLDLEAAPTISSVAALQTQLEAQQRVLVSYYIEGADLDGWAPTSHAFIVTPHMFRAVPLAVHADTIRARLAAISPLLGEDNANGFGINAVRFDLTALHQLYTEIFAPVADALPPELPLTIIPDGPLFQLPFGMLLTESPGMSSFADAPYLLRERPLSMELSGALIGDAPQPSEDVAFDIAALGRTRFETVPSLPPALRSRLDATGGLPALPGVRRELDAVSERFARRRILLNEQATERRLHTLQPQTKVLHLASHALIHPSDPLANLFVLSPDSSGDTEDDGLLFLHELGGRHAPVPLVVLSGCRTARGLMRTGEGPKGLQYAFRSGGTRSTLSTLWDADDETTVLLTSAFYDHLLEGLPKDVALQQAQLDVLEQRPDRASPFFWAGAVLYGAPQPLALEPAPSVPFLPIAAGGAILLLVALGFGYSRYRRHHS